jgi:1,2-diacylglycerol 3-beta-glucosyltransferase
VVMPPPEPDQPSGKWRPLKEGMRLSTGEGLVLTDADAVLSPNWVQAHLQELGSAQMAAGFVVISGERLWDRVQGLDWIYLQCAGSSLTRWGLPQSAFGKNLALRRLDYEAVGGLEGVGYSVTEDLALVAALAKRKATMAFPPEAKLAVTTHGAATLAAYLRQRKRWIKGFRHLRFSGQSILFIAGIRHLAIIIGLLTVPLWALGTWLVTAIFDYLILIRGTKPLGIRCSLNPFLLWEVFYTWSALLSAWALLLGGKVEWKGRPS